MDVAISGASGFVGTALTRSLRDDGHRVRRLVRRPSDEPDTVSWDPEGGSIDAAGLADVTAVVHLAGASIGGARWSARYKQAIRDSRVKGTILLARTLAELDPPPQVLLSASGVHAYGDRGDEVLTEESSRGKGFLAEVVAAWEEAAAPAQAAGIRTVFGRSGLVLSGEGGVLPQMLRPIRLGVGGRLGSGRQWMSWISLVDEVGALRMLLDRDDIAGPVNLVAPAPVTNRDFTEAAGRVLHRPTWLPVPKFAPRLLLGREMADELLFGSLRVRPATLEKAGYQFRHPDIQTALEAIL